TGEIAVNTNTLGWQRQADVAIDATGNFIVTWTTQPSDGDSSEVAARRFDAAGAPLGAEFQVNTTTTGVQSASAIALVPGGGFWITGDTYDQGGVGRDIFAHRFDAAGLPAGGEFQVNDDTTGEQTAPAIAIDSTGTATIAWDTATLPGPPIIDGPIS